MRAIDALHAPWAIRRETLQTMLEVYERHASGDIVDMTALEAAIGKPLANDPPPYSVDGGIATINVVGVLGKRFDMFMSMCGGASTQRLQSELAMALEDPSVHGIVLNIDSPGGEVDGTQALASDIYAARGQKPIVAVIDGMGASAAYWIASAADQVFITGDTTAVGSIGVVIAHRDVSRAEEARGVKTTEITAGKYKRIASSYAPLSQEGRQSLQIVADHIYSVFVDEVARNLGVDAETVLKSMADGRLFLGQKAVEAGLVNGALPMREVTARLKDSRQMTPEARKQFMTGGKRPALPRTPGTPTPRRTSTGASAPPQEKTAMEQVTINGAVCSDQTAVDAAVEAAVNNAKTQARAEGVTAERERIAAINKLALPGHDALVAKAIESGTPASEVATSIVEAEKGKRAQTAANLVADAPAPVPAASAPAAPVTPTEPDAEVIADKARSYQASQKQNGKVVGIADAVAAVRREMGLK